MVTPSNPPATGAWGRRRRLRTLAVTGVVLATIAAALLFGWSQLEPFHQAQRDADRVFRALTGTAPVQHQRSGNYLGFDQAPTVSAFGPLPAATTVRAEMARFSAALARAGYRPSPWSQRPSSWCGLDSEIGFGDSSSWAPDAAPPSSITVRCTIDAADADGRGQARLTLQFHVRPAQLGPTRTITGYFTVSAGNAVDLPVINGMLEASVTR